MDIAIERLNKTVELREKMIEAILYSKRRTERQYDQMETRLQNTGFMELKKQYEKLAK